MSKYALVRWVGEETLSVVLSSTTARKSEKVYSGSFTEFKWGGKQYEAEVLKLSGLIYFSWSLYS